MTQVRRLHERRLLEGKEKASIKTPSVVRQGNDLLVVTYLEKVAMPLIEPLHTANGRWD